MSSNDFLFVCMDMYVGVYVYVDLIAHVNAGMFTVQAFNSLAFSPSLSSSSSLSQQVDIEVPSSCVVFHSGNNLGWQRLL